MFVFSVLTAFWFFLLIKNFRCINNHWNSHVDVRKTRFNSTCLLKTLWLICKKHSCSWQIVRAFEACQTFNKSIKTVDIAITIQTVFSI